MNEYQFKNTIPVLRIFDENKAREFYIDFLGFSIDWEHRYEEDFPIYMQVSLGDCSLHLSEHHGDSSPGIKLRVHVEGIQAYHQFLAEKNYKFARPGLEEAHGFKEVRVGDPFGNEFCFVEKIESLKSL
ncbi:glyoxalase superfamily protein [Fictibacillus phosphorivorans]|uniref:glyoxalase superfamily protein n=2 Tax=Fictibacillus TaxID=1329200 RepID=UPI0011A86B46|nr:glyoxalase superfamily protein [Fictibacillus phosphorivorans]